MDPRQLQRIARQQLRTDALLGVEHVPRHHAEPAVQPPPPEPAGPPARGPEPQAPRPAPQRPPAPATPATPAARAAPPADEHRPAPPDALPPLPAEPMTTAQKAEQLDALNDQYVRGCRKCPLHEARTNTVFGEGSPDAPILFIGEGPGQTEDEQGRPFVGRAGELLTKMIEAIGYQRDDVYIANIVKCRPPNNRAPTPAEVHACWPYLRRQIEVIRPKVIVTLGGPAAKALLETKEGITRLRGTWHEYNEVDPPISVMPTFHPAYLLRSYTRENRARVWSDLQAARDRAEGNES